MCCDVPCPFAFAFVSPMCLLGPRKRTRSAGGAESLGRESFPRHPLRASAGPLVYVSGGRGVAAKTVESIRALGGRVESAIPSSALTDNAAVKEGYPGSSISAFVFAVGAGNPGDERKRWEIAVEKFRLSGGSPLGVFVARSIIIPELLQMLRKGVEEGGSEPRWVILRPGALVEEETMKTDVEDWGRVLLTDDVRVNGIISRERVARVVAEIAIGGEMIYVERMLGKVVGVYDVDRVVSLPAGVRDFVKTK